VETRERILAAAERVMREHGLARATTKEIARAAGVSEGTLYNHFANKEELFLCVLREQLPGFIAAVVALPRRAGTGTVRGNLIEVARSALAFYTESVPLGTSVHTEPARLARLREETAKRNVGPQKANESVAAYLRAEQELGRVPADVNPEAAADLLLGACFQRAYLLPFLPPDAASAASGERFIAAVVDTLLRGIGAR